MLRSAPSRPGPFAAPSTERLSTLVPFSPLQVSAAVSGLGTPHSRAAPGPAALHGLGSNAAPAGAWTPWALNEETGRNARERSQAARREPRAGPGGGGGADGAGADGGGGHLPSPGSRVCEDALNCNGRSLRAGAAPRPTRRSLPSPREASPGLSCPRPRPAPHLRRRARRARGSSAPGPRWKAACWAASRSRRAASSTGGGGGGLRGRLRLRHCLLQDAPQLLGAQQGTRAALPRWGKGARPPLRPSLPPSASGSASAMTADAETRTQVAERRRLRVMRHLGKEAATSAPQAKTSRKATAD